MPDRAPFAICSIDDLEHNGSWALARRGLDLTSFGLNVVDIAPGDAIPEHDERGRDQEEVFVTLAGDAVLVIDGQDHPLPPGTLARLDPELRRTVRNDGDVPARILIASAPRTSGFEPMSWA